MKKAFVTLLLSSALGFGLIPPDGLAKVRPRPFVEQIAEAVYLIGEGTVHGTGFLVSCQEPDSATTVFMVSARHTFENIVGDSLTVYLRREAADTGYEIAAYRTPLRQDRAELFISHTDSAVDLAALPVELPRGFDVKIVDRSYLASADDFRTYTIHAGETVHYLGYPGGQSSPTGLYPLVRTGHLASLPVDPHGILVIDGPIFAGNSGGPIFIEPVLRFNRYSQIEKPVPKVIGIVTAALADSDPATGAISESETSTVNLGLAVSSVRLLELLAQLECER
jgi:hypothetical protein